MDKRTGWGMVIPFSLVIAGCASPPPQQMQEVQQLHQQVGQLNKEMTQLTRQASALEQQNSLNANSSQGAWLLPAANTAVVLQSQMGELRLSLSHIETEASGTQALLHIRAAGDNHVAGFSAQIAWGERDQVTGKPLMAGMQEQQIHVDAELLPRSEVTVPLRMGNIMPGQLGYVRVHDIQPDR